MKSITPWQAVLFASAAVFCFHLSYFFESVRPLQLLMVAYVALVIQLTRLPTLKSSFYAGIVTGFLCAAPHLLFFWGIFKSAAIPLWMILAFWTGAFVGLGHAVLFRFGRLGSLVLLPFIWTGLEYFRSELYPLRFSWLNSGYAFANCPLLPFHVWGMYGVGFCLAALGAAWLVAPSMMTAALAMMITVLLHFLGLPTRPTHGVSSLAVAGIQLEAPAEIQIPRALTLLLKAHREADLFVMSEYSLDGPVPTAVKAWCKSNRRYLIIGGKDPAPNGKFYNTAFVVGPNGDVVFRQAKRVPIQFFQDGLPASRQEVWNSPWGKIGLCICYDLSYTRVTDALVRQGAQFLIVPTMDVGDWGRREHQLHGLVAPVRAAEYGIPIFRLASSGISQFVNQQGIVTAHTSFPGDEEILSAQVRLASKGALPLDRLLAPISVAVLFAITALLVVLNARRTISSVARPLARTIGSSSTIA